MHAIITETAQGIVMTLSPFFPITKTPDFSSIRVIYNDAAKMIGVKVHAGPHKQITVTSVTEAEDWLIGNAPVRNMRPIPTDDPAELAIQIQSAGNQIAACSRRGAGTTVMMHPSRWSQLQNANIRTDSCSTEQSGRWRKSGMLLHSDTVWCCDQMPVDQIFIMYQGEGFACKPVVDGPAMMVYNGENFQLMLLDRTSDTLGDWQDYVGVLNIGD
jgi:hypothetical protein